MRTERQAHPIPISRLSRILILRYDALGDMILSTPVWRTLKAQKPDLFIGVAGSAKNMDLLRSDSDIDELYTFSQKSNKGVWKEIKRARNIQWDMIVNLVYNDKSRAAILAWLINPKAIRVTGVREHQALYANLYPLLHTRPPQQSGISIYEQTIDTLRTGVDFNKENTDGPSLILDPKIELAVSDQLEHLLHAVKAKRILHLNTNSSVPYREWGLENAWRFSQQFLINHPDFLILWTGAPDGQNEIINFLSTHRHRSIQYFRTPTPQHLAALVRDATIVVSPDTSVIHIASAEQKPIVGFYIEKTEFLPFEVPNVILHPAEGKRPDTITVESVLNAVQLLLGELQ
jgi:ADP-heptose:LPS heptosyltransferase